LFDGLVFLVLLATNAEVGGSFRGSARDGRLLAPVRNDRRSAGKMTAPSAGFVASRHADAVVGAEH
jgi:hypothetical protein